jgi:hypothetical protein
MPWRCKPNTNSQALNDGLNKKDQHARFGCAGLLKAHNGRVQRFQNLGAPVYAFPVAIRNT